MDEKLLTASEKSVHELIVNQGMNNTEIANRLGISLRTTKFHVSNLLRKLGFPDRVKMAVVYWTAGGRSTAAQKHNGAPKKSATKRRKVAK